MDIVFDLGGVIFNWRPEELLTACFPDERSRALARREVLQHSDWRELDRGTLDYPEVATRAHERGGLSVQQVLAFLESVPPSLTLIGEAVDLVWQLREQGHRLFYLSNMHAASIAHIEQAAGVWGAFEGGVVSCRVHSIKPEEAIFRRLEHDFALSLERCVFIDDARENVEAARALKMSAIEFQGVRECSRELAELAGS